MSYSVPSELYREVALRLSEAIGSGGYFSGTLAFAWGEAECRLTASVIVYRRRERLPEGDRDAIADLVPVWWEFHTVGSDGEALNETQFGIENGITFHPYDGYEALVFPQTVPKGCVFVLGDNRTVSRDSRYAEIGMIDTRHIMGEAVFTLYPFDRFGFVKTNENN